MNIFLVFKVAVYRHQCGGAFSTSDSAAEAAYALIRGERDNHHEYEVVPFEINRRTTQDKKGELLEDSAVLRLRRRRDKSIETVLP